MKNVITRVSALLALAALLTVGAFAQAQPNQAFPDQVVGAAFEYDQAAAAPVAGSVFYAKLESQSIGLYSYTRIVEKSVSLKPKLAIETQTETGQCKYVTKFGAFDVFGCGTIGVATAADQAGISLGAFGMATKSLGKGWSLGFTAGAGRSGATGDTNYPVSLFVSWGK